MAKSRFTKAELVELKKHTAGKYTAGNARYNEAMVCPHCQVRGQVSTDVVNVKKGISGGKATGAILTAGVSLLATGLAHKERVTRATCSNCYMTWEIARAGG